MTSTVNIAVLAILTVAVVVLAFMVIDLRRDDSPTTTQFRGSTPIFQFEPDRPSRSSLSLQLEQERQQQRAIADAVGSLRQELESERRTREIQDAFSRNYK